MSWSWTSLFKRLPMRTFASLDNQGHCLAFKQCKNQPDTGNWVEINEVNLAWFNAPLPPGARVCSYPHPDCAQRSLTARALPQ